MPAETSGGKEALKREGCQLFEKDVVQIFTDNLLCLHKALLQDLEFTARNHQSLFPQWRDKLIMRKMSDNGSCWGEKQRIRGQWTGGMLREDF